MGAGWDGLRGGCGLEVCGCRAGKNSQTPAGAWRYGFKFCRCRAGADTKFQPVQDSIVYACCASVLWFCSHHFRFGLACNDYTLDGRAFYDFYVLFQKV